MSVYLLLQIVSRCIHRVFVTVVAFSLDAGMRKSSVESGELAISSSAEFGCHVREVLCVISHTLPCGWLANLIASFLLLRGIVPIDGSETSLKNKNKTSRDAASQ